MTAQTNEFLATLATINARMADIQSVVDDHLDATPDAITWGNVADANRLLADLERITAYLAP